MSAVLSALHLLAKDRNAVEWLILGATVGVWCAMCAGGVA